ncbi:metal ABC transporter permease [Candidatus Darwinibacter acetoxidans]|jgi:manganese/iron transport system permease protein|nr:metal ABC transporter permease [Limnochordia bacterium]MDI9465209.1 metal ABC transporter permease [Bacillota bacterium]NLO94701.1 metal ABC transporter permease [Bacillota bacterium]HOB39870.1 metal ABC transporter permease [Limnochordia bacterium]HOK31669.1 metal ABC transporter permease [Limnochordia bacterium]
MNLELLLEPLQYGFMVRAFVGVGLVAVVAAAIGTFVVLKGLAFMGDAIAHTAFTGIAVGLLLGISIHVSALFFALVTSLGVVVLTRVSNVRNDTALAILFTGVFALGIVLLSTSPGFMGDLNSLLLGSVLAIQAREIVLIAAFALLLVVVLVLFFPQLVLASFDPLGAEAAGFPVVLFQSLLLALTAVAIVISIQAVGVVLVVALLITPAATAGLVTKRLKLQILLAALFGLVSSFLGLYISYFFGAPPGATVVLVATLFFTAALTIQRLRSRGGAAC